MNETLSHEGRRWTGEAEGAEMNVGAAETKHD